MALMLFGYSMRNDDSIEYEAVGTIIDKNEMPFEIDTPDYPYLLPKHSLGEGNLFGVV